MKESPRKRSFIFSRDCLEVDVMFEEIVITLFVNHFKSMVGGRSRTRARRVTQARAVKQIVTDRFGPDPGRHPFIILGDLNDYMETDRYGQPGIEDIVNWGQVENVVERLPIEQRWTHYYKRQKAYRQLDYILTSNVLSAKVKTVEIERGGVPRRAAKYAGPRYRGVGEDYPKASDHCPLMVEIKL
jgi:predicted extracellular nuclease